MPENWECVKRKISGALMAGAGLVLIVLAVVTAYQNSCPASTYNGTGPPPSTAPCTGHFSWTAVPFTLLVVGIVLIPIGAVVARLHRA